MTATDTDFEQYVDKKVVLTVKNDDGQDTELEGTIQATNELGVLIKPKGKTLGEIVDAENIVQVVLAASPEKKIKAKKIKPIVLGQARGHLLERHGVTLTEANGMTEEEAFAAHEEIDHVNDDLGHVHVEPKAKDPEDGQQQLPDAEVEDDE